MIVHRGRMGTAVLVVALLGTGLALAQAVPPAAKKPAATPGAAADVGLQQKDEQMLQKIQRENESVITGKHFTYDPAGRRDPFEPLVKPEQIRDAKRPKGIAGMSVSEIDLKGVATDTRGTPIAMFRGTDNRGYTVRVGDVVYDGRVIAIDPVRGVVVFRQQVDDPRRIKPYRDVIKRLQVTGGEDNAAEEEGA